MEERAFNSTPAELSISAAPHPTFHETERKTTMVRRSRYDEDFVDELPWDPLWDYMLGEGQQQQTLRGKQIEGDNDSFLDYLFPSNEAAMLTNSSSRPKKEKKSSSKSQSVSFGSSSKKKSGSRKFWRRNKKDNEEWDLASLASSFEFFDDEDDKKQKSRSDKSEKWWTQNQSQSRSLSPQRSSTRQAALAAQTQASTRKVTSTTKKSSKNRSSVVNSPSLLEELAHTLDPWGMDDYSESDGTASEFYDASSYESSSQTEEPSLLTDDDSSTIASRSDASSLLRDRDQPQRDAAYNEVRLKFKPATQGESTALLPPLYEDGSHSDMFAGYEERDEATPYLTKRESAGSIQDDADERVDLGPEWDVAPVVLATDELQPGDRSLASSTKGYPRAVATVDPSGMAAYKEQSAPENAFEKSLPRGLGGKIVCCSIKNATQDEMNWSKQSGLPIHELSSDELATIFPKLRLVSDKNESNFRSAVIGNSNSFEKNLPAHLQLPPKALIADSGPQSLFEYEYERGKHMKVSFAGFGPLPRTLIKVETYEEPPPSYERGLVSYNKVLVQVEASTVSQTDCFIRRGEWWGTSQVSLPNTPGVDFVGKLYRIDKESTQRTGLKKGDRVIALTKWGGNSRYLPVDPATLVKVPELVDPAEAACLVETYLTAFQLLHFGQSPGSRYRKAALKGKSFLVVGAMTPNMGRAIAQLATHSGADMVYATSKPKHFQQLSALGFVPLSQDPLDWWEKLNGKVDLIISLGEEVTPLFYKLLKRSGEIVIATHSEVDLAPDMELVREPSKLICSRGKTQRKSRTAFYDVFNEWDVNLGKCRKDLTHLVRLLETRAVSPYVIDRVPLGKVARAQELVESKRLSGFLVCEPWLLAKSRAIRL